MDQEKVTAPETAIVCLDDNESEPLTGKPFFNMTMGKSYLQTTLPLPTKFIGLLPKNENVPVILSRGSRSWHMNYYQKRFNNGWNAFVVDNMLKIGDVCLFELMSSDVTLLKFKVQILRGDFPAALLNREREAQDSDAPVIIEIE